jgi:hypothetical protein
MINRKNDGTVKMTRQRATTNTYSLGMTGDSGTVERYLESHRNSDNIENSSEAGLEAPSFVYLFNFKHMKLRLHWTERRDGYFFTQDDLMCRLHRRSAIYGSRNRAMRARKLNQILWIETTALPFSLSV